MGGTAKEVQILYIRLFRVIALYCLETFRVKQIKIMEVFLLNIILIALCILLVDQYGADSPDTKSITNETTGM